MDSLQQAFISYLESRIAGQTIVVQRERRWDGEGRLVSETEKSRALTRAEIREMMGFIDKLRGTNHAA